MEIPSATRSPIRVLLVEDSPLDAELVSARMEADGLSTVVTRVDTRDALVAALDGGAVDVVLSDFQLPDFDGMAALDIVRSRLPDVPFVFVSGALGEELAIDTLRRGATDYVLKHRLERLSPAVRRALREAADRAAHRRTQAALAFLSEASVALAGSIDFATTAAAVARAPVPFLAAGARVDLYTDDGRLVRVDAHGDPAPDEDAVTTLLRAVPRRAREYTARRAGPWAGREHLLLPLAARREPIGVLVLVGAPGHTWDTADVGVAEDLAHRAGLALDAARLYHQARLADQRKTDFLAMLGHELRNPLSALVAAAEIIKLRGGSDPSLGRALGVVDRQVCHMTRLVDDLLDVARITRGKLDLHHEPVDVARVVQNAVETTRALIDARRHAIEVALPGDGLWVLGDRTRIEQVLGNLLTNAAKYTDEGGRIWLTALRDGGDAVLRVRDTGVGISHEMLPRVFELFVQVSPTERSQGGLGLGLTLVRMLVELHGGTVTARSDGVGQGTEFELRLPLTTPPVNVQS